MQRQRKSPDGKRRSRWLIVRSTLPKLESTTLKTWDDWFPEAIFGVRSRKPPYTQKFRYNDIEAEIIFIALDGLDDVDKLLSFECTGIWFNEAREQQKDILDAATGRVGRYPRKADGGCSWAGVIMDTNPPDDSHWWHTMFEEEKPPNWELFHQPGGTTPEAENFGNLPDGYYDNMSYGKTKEWINVYVNGKYGFIQDGKPVYGSSWNDDLHTAQEEIALNPHGTVYCGVDCSGRNPSAVFAQRNNMSGISVLSEICIEDTGAVAFSQILKNYIDEKYHGMDVRVYGDPAGAFKQNTDERTYMDIMWEKGIRIYAAPTTNRLGERIQAVESCLLKMAGGKPYFLTNKACTMLRRGFNGGYKFRRVSASGDARYTPEPEKNRFSHVHDSLQYLALGMGEGRKMKGHNSERSKPVQAKMGFKL